MRFSLLSLAVSLCMCALAVPSVHAFSAELEELRNNLMRLQIGVTADSTDMQRELEEIGGSSFSDVGSGQWFSPYVLLMHTWGIISGYKDETGQPTGIFGPGNPVTIAEILKMAYEAAQVNTDQCGTAEPANISAAGHWAAEYVVCGEADEMRILADTSLSIDRNATRAEVISIMHDAFGDEVLPLFAPFSDTVGHPFEADIGSAYVRGVVTGDTNADGQPAGTFRPDSPVNRAEAAKIIYQRLVLEVTDTW